MEHIKSKNYIIALFLLFTCCSSQSPSEDEDVLTCCIRKQLESNDKTNTTPEPIKGSRGVYKINNKDKLFISKNFLKLNETDLIANDSISNSIGQINIDSIKVYRVKLRNKSYVLLRSQVESATGLAVNFYTWLLIDIDTNRNPMVKVLSLCSDGKAIYVKDGILYFTLFDFADDFYLKEKDFDNPPIKIITYQLMHNRLAKLRQDNIICKCD